MCRSGHDVPAADVIRRFVRSRRNFWDLYRPLVNTWTLDHDEVSGFHRVAVGTREGLAVYDDEMFAALRYATDDRISVVMFNSQDRTALADSQTATLTCSLINAALAEGGTYYLPYRPHATREQFACAYPTAEASFAAKARFDPDTLFRNGFYDTYGPSDAGQ